MLGRVNRLPSILFRPECSLKTTAALKCPHSMRNLKRILDLVLLKYVIGVIMPSDATFGLGVSCCIKIIRRLFFLKKGLKLINLTQEAAGGISQTGLVE